MKSIKKLNFANQELKETTERLLAWGFTVFTFEPIGGKIGQIFYTKGGSVGSIHQKFGGVDRSVCYKSLNGSGFGTGAGWSEDIEYSLKTYGENP